MDYRDAIDRMLDPYEQEDNECPICGVPQNHEGICGSTKCIDADNM